MKASSGSKLTLAAVALCMLFIAGSVMAAQNAYIYLKIEGSKQGKFAGGNSDGTITLTDFSYSAMDTSSGMASGKRMHSSITIRKEIDKASPMFAVAVKNSEVLTNVELDFAKMGPGGKPQIYKSLVIKNANISTIHRVMGGDKQEEVITISYDPADAIAKDAKGNKTVMDDWMSQ